MIWDLTLDMQSKNLAHGREKEVKEQNMGENGHFQVFVWE